MTIMAIDPGLQGGIAVNNKLFKMPTKNKGSVDSSRLLSLLIDNKVNIEEKDNCGLTAKEYATKYKWQNVLKYINEHSGH